MSEPARKSTLGSDNPLETLQVGVRPKFEKPKLPEEHARVPKLALEEQREGKTRVSFHLPTELAEKVRDCVFALSGPPHRLTMGALCEQALENELKRLLREAGLKEFPKRTEDLKGGARVV